MEVVIRNTGGRGPGKKGNNVTLGSTHIDMIVLASTIKDGAKIGTSAIRRHMGGHMITPAKAAKIGRKSEIITRRYRIMKLEAPALRVKRVREGHHRSDADPATHEEASSSVVSEVEMVDRTRDEHLPPFIEDAMHQQ